MNNKTLFVAFAAASLVATLTLAPVLASAVGQYLNIKEAKVTVEDSVMTAKFTTEENIPTAGAFGYGIITEITPETTFPITAVVTTTHASVLDSEDQVDADDPVWHNHYVRLVSGEGVCESGIQVGDITWESPGHVNVNKNKAIIQGFPLEFDGTHSLTGAQLSFEPGTPLVGASFTLGPVYDEEGNLTNVCVSPVDFPQEITLGN